MAQDLLDVRGVQAGVVDGQTVVDPEIVRIPQPGPAQDLDRDLASELRIASTIDLAHPAHPDQCLYLKGAEAPQPLVLVSCQRRLKQLVDLMPAFSRNRPSRASLSARHLS